MKTTFLSRSIWGLLALGYLAACGSANQPATNDRADTVKATATVVSDSTPDNALPPAEQAEGFRLLFDGQSTQGWHSYLKDSVAGWKAQNGELTTQGKTGADLVSNDEFENFDLRFDWKIEAGGNSGVFYLVQEDPKFKNTFDTAPEYQIIDDQGYGQPVREQQKSGANYDMHAPAQLAAKAPGQWNSARIVIDKGHVEHWLNGQKVVDYQYGSNEWSKLVAASKFAKWGYATPHSKGKIALQDHGDPVSYKNIRVRTW